MSIITTYLNINVNQESRLIIKKAQKYGVHNAWEPLKNAKQAEMHSIHHEFNSKAFHNTKGTKAQPK